MTMEQNLIDKFKTIYGKDCDLILKAYEFADVKHKGQMRDTGKEYISHPLAVAEILADMNADVQSVVVGLLHDCLEDCDCTEDEICKFFGEEIKNLCVGYSKIEFIKQARMKNPEEIENLRKMLLALAKDARVAFVKLADRLDNLRTLGVKERAKQVKIAQETLDLFVPLAERLSANKLKRELENQCFMFIFPEDYVQTTKFIEENFKKREKITIEINETIKQLAKNHNVEVVKVQSRIKSNYGVFVKMQKKGKESIFDVVAHRIILKEIKDCYTMLGAVHEKWKPVDGRIKDYIAHPKPNFYRSLHTTVYFPSEHGDVPFEIQIRTEEMHNFCEYGFAAHWMYKEAGSKASSNHGNAKMLELKNTELQNEGSQNENKKTEDNAEDYMQVIKAGLYSDKVFIFTPKLNVIELQEGANSIDLAYNIHSALGNRSVGTKINGKMVPIFTKLNTGDIVEIITSSNSKGPSKDWLKVVRMQSTRDKINAFFRKNMREEHIKKGKTILEQAAKAKGYALPSLMTDEILSILVEKMRIKDMDEVYAQLGYGSLASAKIINRLISLYEEFHKADNTGFEKNYAEETDKKDTDISGLGGIMTKLAKCCTPIPGDDIVGYISRGRGITVHRKDCPIVQTLEQDRLMEVDWGTKALNERYSTVIKIVAKNSPNTLGLISNKLAENKLTLNFIYSEKSKSDDAVYNIGIEVKNKHELNDFINKLEAMQEVYYIFR